MRIRNWAGASWPIIMLGIFFMFILQGCTEVTVKCGPGMTMAKDDTGAGGCNSMAYTGPIPANTVCKNINNVIIQCPAGATCSSGTKCNDSNPGIDANRKPCRTVWKESSPGSTNGNCTCTGY